MKVLKISISLSFYKVCQIFENCEEKKPVNSIKISCNLLAGRPKLGLRGIFQAPQPGGRDSGAPIHLHGGQLQDF